MAITRNIELIKDNLINLGLNYEEAAEIIANRGDGFAVSYSHLEDDKAYAVCVKLRTVLYSWLSLLGVKKMYSIGIRNNAVTVGRKLTVDSVDIVPIQIVATRNRSKKAKKQVYPVFAEAEGSYNTMPDQDAIESAEYIEALFKENDDPLLREVLARQEQSAATATEPAKKLSLNEILQTEGQKLQDNRFDPTQFGLQDPENSFEE